MTIPRETMERLLGLLVFLKAEMIAVNSAPEPGMRMALLSKNLGQAMEELYGRGRGPAYDGDVKALRQALGYEPYEIPCKTRTAT